MELVTSSLLLQLSILAVVALLTAALIVMVPVRGENTTICNSFFFLFLEMHFTERHFNGSYFVMVAASFFLCLTFFFQVSFFFVPFMTSCLLRINYQVPAYLGQSMDKKLGKAVRSAASGASGYWVEINLSAAVFCLIGGKVNYYGRSCCTLFCCLGQSSENLISAFFTTVSFQ